ncbi:hypothetical protein [Sphingobacterium pedocola]|uniref:hypothetical protein n=1 Tax=Sphingobacterium pedocola TaxID=2082722 RepID=UPI0018CA95B1|nr:hypothetical protein [Sphingobacterium pedocola]
MVKHTTPEPMFKFSTTLYTWKSRIKKNGNSSLYLQVYISHSGAWDRDYFNLNLDWSLKDRLRQ